MEGRQTNIDVDVLAASPIVRKFMHRVLAEEMDPLTGHVFAINLAKRAADAFDLFRDDARSFPPTLITIATDVIDEARALEGRAR